MLCLPNRMTKFKVKSSKFKCFTDSLSYQMRWKTSCVK